MKRFTTNIGRGFRAVVRGRPQSRQARLRDTRVSIQEDQQSPITSPLSPWDTRLVEQLTPRGSALDTSTELHSPLDGRANEDANEGDVASRTQSVTVDSSAESTFDYSERSHRLDSSNADANAEDILEPSNPYDGPLSLDTQLATQQVPTIKDQAPDEEALRAGECLVFDQEEETDYTAGPSRFVNAFDGVAEVSAVLMTLDFSRKVQAALQAQRAYEKADRETEEELASLLRYESKIKCEITDHEYRLSLLEPSGGSDGPDDRELDMEDKSKEASLRRELDILRRMLEDSKTQREVMQYRLQDQAYTLRQIQAEANVYLEDAFVHARLLAPQDDSPDTPVEELDIQEEYKKYAGQTEAVDGGDANTVAPLDTSRDHMYVPPPSDEQQAQQALKEAFWTAQQQLRDAGCLFDRWQNVREMELEGYKAAIATGEATVDADRDAFDRRWLQEVSRLTRQVIHTEEAVASSKAAALAAGINIATPDAASGFIDDVDDGYALSFEQDMIVAAPVEKIYQWFNHMDGVPKVSISELPEVPDMYEWNSRPVDNSDSFSMVFLNDERRRVDRSHVHRGGALCRSASIASEGDGRRRITKRRFLGMGVGEIGVSGLPLLADDQRIFDRFWRFDQGPLLLVGAPTSEPL